jgi:HPt (histidine-containing phosphotransfer) domain-containing protein
MADPLDRAALDELRAMVGGEPDLYVEMLDAFLSDAALALDEMRAAVARDDAAAFRRPAHSLKSNAMTVGAARLAELCRALETDARDGAVDAPGERVGLIADEAAAVASAVRAEREGPPDGS